MALAKAAKGNGNGRGRSAWGGMKGVTVGTRRTRSTVDSSTPLDSPPDIMKDDIPTKVEEQENKEEEIQKKEASPIPIQNRKLQKARRGKPYIGGSGIIRNLQKVEVSLKRTDGLKAWVDDTKNEKKEDSKEEEKVSKTEEKKRKKMKTPKKH